MVASMITIHLENISTQNYSLDASGSQVVGDNQQLTKGAKGATKRLTNLLFGSEPVGGSLSVIFYARYIMSYPTLSWSTLQDSS